MRLFRIVGLTIVATVTIIAIAAVTASAELPEFSPGAAGTKFSETSASGTLTTKGGTIVCKSATGLGELTNNKGLFIQTNDFKECTAFGVFSAQSLEDSEGVILVKSDLHLCYINKAKKEVGALTELTTKDPVGVHIEVAGKLMEIKGDQVARLTPVNVLTKTYTKSYASGLQCEGKTETLLASENEGPFDPGTTSLTFTTVFLTNQTLVA